MPTAGMESDADKLLINLLPTLQCSLSIRQKYNPSATWSNLTLQPRQNIWSLTFFSPCRGQHTSDKVQMSVLQLFNGLTRVTALVVLDDGRTFQALILHLPPKHRISEWPFCKVPLVILNSVAGGHRSAFILHSP